MEIKTINRKEALRYLSYGNSEPTGQITGIIDECENQLLRVIQPRYVYNLFDIVFIDKGIKLEGCNLILEGNDIKNHLEGCSKAVLFCATISAGADRNIRVAEISDMTKALILDSLASVAVEQVCDYVDGEIREKYNQYYQTWRFSAGYGDLPISIQGDFLKVLDANKRIGVFVNESNILTPRKSVTAIIGLSENPVDRKKRGCESCNLKDVCQFRKNGTHCS